MPEYTFHCENCGIQFNRHQKFNEEPLKICPECGTKALRKVYKPARIVFKGSGFYATDHRSSSRSTYLDKGGETSPDTGKGSEADSKRKADKPTAKESTKSQSAPKAE